MPSLFHDRIRKMRICAFVQLGCFILAIISGGIFIECLFYNVELSVFLCLGSVVCICVLVILFCSRYLKKDTDKLVQYEIPTWASDLEEVAQALSAGQMDSNSYVSFQKRGRISVRILVQYNPEFDKKEASRNRKRVNKVINTKFGVSSRVSMYDALSSIRINMAVCNRRNDDLISWVNTNTGMLLHRNEAILSAAVILDENKLIFPACMENLTIAELNRYEAACLVLAGCLGSSAEDTENRLREW